MLILGLMFNSLDGSVGFNCNAINGTPATETAAGRVCLHCVLPLESVGSKPTGKVIFKKKKRDRSDYSSKALQNSCHRQTDQYQVSSYTSVITVPSTMLHGKVQR